ncbi:hypothetical protein [Actinoplanes sp. NPDC051851]|uniref:hypothetical protein n=1 Tax=Actinoplanes sp. NPDC051851 TaxID=3154753 RepID=UPI00343C0E13
MATIIVRGLLRRTLPTLLALLLSGFAVLPFTAGSAEPATSRASIAAAHIGQTATPSPDEVAEPDPDPVPPVDDVAGAPAVSDTTQAAPAQATVRASGSRAPPASLA